MVLMMICRYIVCNMKNSEEGAFSDVSYIVSSSSRVDPCFIAFIGDTICWADKLVEPLPGFKPMKAMVSPLFVSEMALLMNMTKVYAGVFPMDSADFPKLEESIERVGANFDVYV